MSSGFAIVARAAEQPEFTRTEQHFLYHRCWAISWGANRSKAHSLPWGKQSGGGGNWRVRDCRRDLWRTPFCRFLSQGELWEQDLSWIIRNLPRRDGGENGEQTRETSKGEDQHKQRHAVVVEHRVVRRTPSGWRLGWGPERGESVWNEITKDRVYQATESGFLIFESF